MLLRKEVGNQKPEGLGNLLEAMLRRSSAVPEPDDDPLPTPSPDDTSGRYDFDLAEFPLFRFHRTPAKSRDPLAYTDELYALRGYIQQVRERLQVRISAAANTEKETA